MNNDHTGIRYYWNKYQLMVAVFIVIAIVFMGNISFAAEKSSKYQVVAVNDKAYLLDTTTGFTWILTYRTIATGREPVAIPYKFIKISPANQKEFIVETDQGVSLLPNGGQ
ncbi:MAG: hypothetical protein AB2L12_03000 [Smithellaceae bacterium]